MDSILYEDNHLIAVNKKAGEIVQGDKTGDIPLSETLKKYIKEKYDKPGDVFLGVPHRLDRPVSGVMLFARTSKALTRLNKMFQQKELQKNYWAVVRERPPHEKKELVHYIMRDSSKNKSFAYDKPRDGAKEARLEYELMGQSDHYYLLEVLLHTGRHHQIRCQLAKIGCAVKGDLKYGFPRSNPDGGIHLHARKLSFVHPIKNEPVTLIAPTPDDPLWNAFSKMLT